MGEWDLTDELRDLVKPLVEEFIEKLKSTKEDEDEVLELSRTGINPIQLEQLLEELGYKDNGLDSNGWQHDYWWYMIDYKKNDNSKKLCIHGCAMCHNINLSMYE